MQKSRFTNEQIDFGLRQVESGTPLEEVCRKLGISQQTSIGGRRSFQGWVLRNFGG
jgi:putative transposase